MCNITKYYQWVHGVIPVPRSGPLPFPQATPTTLDPLPGTPDQFPPLPNNGRHAYHAADTSACLPAVGISQHSSASAEFLSTNITLVHPSAVLDRPPLKFVGFVPTLLYLRNPRAGLVQGGSTRAEPDTLSHTSVVTVGHPSAIIALCRPVSANPWLMSAYLRLRPPASVSVGDRRSQPELNTRCIQ
ncbi:hypothetical protein PISMIDRAFT_16971 [Pisolithus microcarpus 441]|uniref:Uncharacterized protein n=1 Tax=Pisolithus microcarpus 441 TaxID=765257 RepID=A0A0C9YE27_9AGAM|nr:hypothetical protein BKA83DRAFT_16971 [Pisolithus microcarpus]KIK14896.1 hypothetical protein PISMIDRAFT_16971 [Pisolithus microcarpus 441]